MIPDSEAPPTPDAEQPASPPPTTPAATSETDQPAPPTEQPKGRFAGLSDAEKDRLLSVYSGTIENQRAQLEEQGGQIREIRQRIDAPTPEQLKQRNQEFYERPIEQVTEIVRNEVKAAIEPLAAILQRTNTRSEYDNIKDELKRDEKFKGIFTRGESYIDELIQKQVASGAKVTRDTVISAAIGIHGAQTLGLLGDGGGNGTPTPTAPPPPTQGNSNVQPSFTPPHLRPSASPPPRDQELSPKLRDLTEQEERLRRENGMTKDDFLAAMDMAAGDVVKMDHWPSKKQPAGGK